MKSERQLQEILKSLCGIPGAEDGSDPRDFHKQRGRDKSLRKTYQLCKQVDEVLGYVLSGECDDDVLRDFYVSSVVPAPDASRLLVTLCPYFTDTVFQPVQVLERLGHVAGKLRSEVAAAINRRRTPELMFQVLASPAETPSQQEDQQ